MAKNTINNGIITINAGQLTHAIDITIPTVANAIDIMDYI